MLQALGKQNLNLKRKILVFLLFPTQFCKLGFADPVTTLLNTAATGKTEFKCGKKNACFSAINFRHMFPSWVRGPGVLKCK